MELTAASPVKSRGLSPGDYADDDNDLSDDDRNHKHRRRSGDAGNSSQSPESSAPGPPYARRNNRQFENGRPFREGKFQKWRPGPGGMNRRPVNPNPYPGMGLGPPVGYGGFGAVPMGFRGPVGVGRRRCRDFEEQGFCLRGDMCPMEHGVNRIVVEDVQSLSQFNLPVLLPSGQLLGTPISSQIPPSVPPHSQSFMLTNRGTHRHNSNLGIHDSSLGGVNGVYSGSAAVSGADVYDPDEPLWNNDGPDKSIALSALKKDETEPCTSFGPFEHHHTRLYDDTENELRVAVGSQNKIPSILGRIGGTKDRLDVKEKRILQRRISGMSEDEKKEDANPLTGVHSGPKATDSSFLRNDMMRRVRRPQRAAHTLYVNGIPAENNRREALLAHFQKFGQVNDIYIPAQSEIAFVQFSKKEEAEAALNAPDAVMGNRFIKLFWANRDNILDDNTNNSGSVSLAPPAGAAISAQIYDPNARITKANFQPSAAKSAIIPSSSLPIDHSRPVNVNGPRAPSSSQKKLELEQLKEELRKKQELLEQKRNDFKRQLHKFEKQAGESNGSEIVAEPSPKRQKTGVVAGGLNAATPSLRDPDASVASPRANIVGDRNKSAVNATLSNLKIKSATLQPEPAGSKNPILPTPSPSGTSSANRYKLDNPILPTPSPRGTSSANRYKLDNPIIPTPSPRGTSSANRYKLDNRLTAFKILPPLPSGLANVDALKEHFSSFGEPSSVDLEADESCNSDSSKESRQCAARVRFSTRYSAEKAYVSGKQYKDSTMQCVWITSRNDARGREISLSDSTHPPNAGAQPTGNLFPSNSSEASASKDDDSESIGSIIHRSIEADVIYQCKPCLNGSST